MFYIGQRPKYTRRKVGAFAQLERQNKVLEAALEREVYLSKDAIEAISLQIILNSNC